MQEGRCEHFHQREGSKSILGGFQQFLWRLGSLVPSALTCSTGAMLSHPTLVGKRPLVGVSSRTQQRGGTLPRGLGQRERVWWDIPRPQPCCWHRACPGFASESRRKELPTQETPLHLPQSASTLHAWPTFLRVPVAVGNMAVGGQDAAADATRASPAAIPRLTTSVSGHHLLKTLAANPHPRTAKLPISPRGSLSGRVLGQRTGPRVC